MTTVTRVREAANSPTESAPFPTPVEPRCLMFGLDGIELAPAVQLLGDGQASFDSAQYFDMFYEGQMIGPAVLSLETAGMAVVYPVVKSKNWPMIHVEFMGLSEKDRLQIARLRKMGS